MKTASHIIAAMALASISAPAVAQDYLPPTELVDAALSDHPDVRGWEARIAGSRSEASRLAAGPHEWMISTSGLQRSVRGFGDFSEFDLALSRGIRLPGKPDIDRRIGALGVEAAENAHEDARHQAALQLLRNWMDWLAIAEIVTINAEQQTTAESELAAIERRFAADAAAEVEIELAREAVAEARAATVRSRGQLSRARSSLAAWFPDLPLPSAPPLISVPIDIQTLAPLRDKVLSNSHEIAFAEANAKRATAVADRARADRFPDPQIGLRAFSERDGEETGIGVTFSIPIGGGAREATTHEQMALAAAARQDVARVHRSITDLADADLIQAGAEFDAWNAASSALQESLSVITRMRAGFLPGAVSLPDLLSAERRHLAVRLMEAEARARASVANLKLKVDAHVLWLD